MSAWPLDNWNSNGNIDVSKLRKIGTDSLPLKNTAYYHKKE